ncbi:histamine N-methyltransferase A-like [Glandiceps talaboti]
MGSQTKVTPLMFSPSDYQRCLDAYLRNTDRATKVYEICSTSVPQKIINGVTSSGEDVDIFRYLGVGSGSGEADINVLIELKKTYPKIRATIWEPSSGLIEDFKERVKDQPALDDIEFEWKTVSIEEQMKNGTNGERFHCILLVGVMAYLDEMAPPMKYLYNLLSKSGTMFNVNSADSSVFDNLRLKFPELLYRHKSVHTSDIVTVFEEIGAEVTLEEVKAVVDITKCLQQDSDEGNDILDLITHTLNFRKTVPKETYDSVFQLLLSPPMVEKRDGKVFVDNTRDVIIVRRA